MSGTQLWRNLARGLLGTEIVGMGVLGKEREERERMERELKTKVSVRAVRYGDTVGCCEMSGTAIHRKLKYKNPILGTNCTGSAKYARSVPHTA
eukprot:3766915-Rhodomonas_salina.1